MLKLLFVLGSTKSLRLVRLKKQNSQLRAALRAREGQVQAGHRNCPGASRAFLGRGDPSLPGETRDERIVLAAPGGILGSRVPGAGGERVLPKGLCPLLLAQAERGELRPTDPVLSKVKGRP